MRIEVLLTVCQIGMFLIQWIIIAATSANLLQGKMKRGGFWAATFMGMILAGISRVFLAITKSILLNIVLCGITIFAVNLVLFKDSLKHRMGVATAELLTSWVGEFITAYLLLTTARTRGISMIYGYDSMYAYPEYVVLSAIYSTLLFFVLFMIVLVLWKGFVNHFWMKEYLLYIIVPLYQLILIMVYYATCRELEQIELTTGVLLVLFSLIIDFSILHLVNGMIQKMQVERDLAALYTQRQTEMKYYEIAVQNVEEMKKIRSDFGSQLQNMYMLLKKQEDKSEVKEILDVSAENLKKSSLKRYCENSIVNAILAIKVAAATEKRIVLECDCNVAEETGIEMIDLCSLFANLMDNALEACEKIPEEKKRWISVRSSMRGGYLTIKIENASYQATLKERDRFLTSKSDMRNHGYGLKLINEIVHKYDGNIQISEKENVFSVVASLKTSV